ncbi:putative membrane protein [Wickerhamomyces ciferrii]|uniref:Membrane protein n=1 Tax=Wickerhamomyces ciferrii (strain ATCC 14091 / BCRC 22168 / CBS 111 / JCM 3599 / NBRC 0793 / NRRL Y-1031 F-60-10) TaxID=1206466 RepID=K0KSC8_WICCF|nr:uncharacterized protein BN7_4486 [Wickerhamomyces ciferrii]CCH44917.1 putative membrane protein [Wickerhamomyces ciferrii]
MDAATIGSLLKPMNATQIIDTIGVFQKSGLNTSEVDIPKVLSVLNVTQIQGVLSSNSSVVTTMMQQMTPVQLVTVLHNFQNVTTNLFKAAANSTSVEQATQYKSVGESLIKTLIDKLQNVFTNQQLLGVFSILSKGAALGTGTKKLLDTAKDLLGGFYGGVAKNVEIPDRLTNLVHGYQIAEFGDYPSSKDIAPSTIFTVIFFLFAIVHLLIFLKNFSLGHRFYISFGLFVYSLIRALGFLLRIIWSSDITQITLGLVSMIFLTLPTVFLPSLNLILAQRIFTWRHPVYGSSKYFTTLMYIIYSFVIAVVVMTIIAACVRINFFISEHHLHMTQQIFQATSVLILLYSSLSVLLILAAFIIKPSNSDKEILTYQPHWIKSFNVKYFVPKGSAAQEAKSIPSSKAHAIRVIHSTSYHYDTTQDQVIQDENSKSLTQNTSIYIIAFSTLLVLIADCFRCASTFIEQYVYEESWIFKPVVMYVMYGALETLINLVYIFGRIDLRFYKPDALKANALPEPEVDGSSASEYKMQE